MIEFFYAIAEYIKSGGVVMVPLLLISFFMWVLIINRLRFMQKLYSNHISCKQAGQLVLENQFPDSRYHGVNSLLVREFLVNRSLDSNLDDFILDETVLRLKASMDRYLALIAVFSAIAPLLGLLGTVIGMMYTFDVITVFGTGNARAMAGGISVSLITTQAGLMVSIPGLYMSGWLQRRSRNLKNKISATGMYLKRFL